MDFNKIKNTLKDNPLLSAAIIIAAMAVVLTAVVLFADFDTKGLVALKLFIIILTVIFYIGAVSVFILNMRINQHKEKTDFANDEEIDKPAITDEPENEKSITSDISKEVFSDGENVCLDNDDEDIDKISGLLNRYAFLENAGDLISKSENGEYAVICIDIDHFNEIKYKIRK